MLRPGKHQGPFLCVLCNILQRGLAFARCAACDLQDPDAALDPSGCASAAGNGAGNGADLLLAAALVAGGAVAALVVHRMRARRAVMAACDGKAHGLSLGHGREGEQQPLLVPAASSAASSAASGAASSSRLSSSGGGSRTGGSRRDPRGASEVGDDFTDFVMV